MPADPDAYIRHQTYVLRWGAHEVSVTLAAYDDIQADVRRLVRESEISGEDERSAEAVREVEAAIASLLAQDLPDLQRATVERLDAFLQAEIAWNRAQLALQSDTDVEDVVDVPASRGRRMFRERPIEARLPREWWRGWTDDQVQVTQRAVRQGVLEGKTNDQIVRNIWGKISADFAGGRIETERRNLRTLVQTATSHASSVARGAVLEANDDVVDGEEYLATLDNRTTAICRALDGTISPVGKGPRPPQHFNCRSTVVPWFEDETDEGEFRPAIGSSGVERVPAGTTYQEWLGRQTHAFQDDTLGKAKGKLFRDGGLTLDRFVAPDGSELTLAQLCERERGAFERAGLPVPRGV